MALLAVVGAGAIGGHALLDSGTGDWRGVFHQSRDPARATDAAPLNDESLAAGGGSAATSPSSQASGRSGLTDTTASGGGAFVAGGGTQLDGARGSTITREAALGFQRDLQNFEKVSDGEQRDSDGRPRVGRTPAVQLRDSGGNPELAKELTRGGDALVPEDTKLKRVDPLPNGGEAARMNVPMSSADAHAFFRDSLIQAGYQISFDKSFTSGTGNAPRVFDFRIVGTNADGTVTYVGRPLGSDTEVIRADRNP